MATLAYGNQSDTNLIYAIYTYKSNVPNCMLDLFLNHKIISHFTVYIQVISCLVKTKKLFIYYKFDPSHEKKI